MDSELARAVSIIQYLVTIISCYFSPVLPQEVKLPATEDEENLLALVGMQFKAFLELGIPINHHRFAQFFKNAVAPSLFSEESILNRADNTIRMFVTMEGSF